MFVAICLSVVNLEQYEVFRKRVDAIARDYVSGPAVRAVQTPSIAASAVGGSFCICGSGAGVLGCDDLLYAWVAEGVAAEDQYPGDMVLCIEFLVAVWTKHTSCFLLPLLA
jgi:hypothetical protein